MKECFKCKQVKPLSDYYKHKKMADGHLNKCKECTKSDTKKRIEEKSSDPEWLESERARGREKHHRLNYKEAARERGRDPEVAQARRDSRKKWIDKYPEKREATNMSQHVKGVDGYEKHHWSYNEEHYKDIIYLTKDHHATAHRLTMYDQERKMFRYVDTSVLLDTKDAYFAFLRSFVWDCDSDYTVNNQR